MTIENSFFSCVLQSAGQKTSRHELSGHMSIKFGLWLAGSFSRFSHFPAPRATSAAGRGRTVGQWAVGHSGRLWRCQHFRNIKSILNGA